MSAAEMTADGWTIRDYDPATDDLLYLLGVSYARSKAGRRANASRAGRKVEGGVTADEVDAQRAFLAAMRPLWLWLLTNADVRLAVDALDPETVWAWTITSEPNVVHAVGCKRSIADAGLASDVIADLLGARMDTHQVCTLELPQLGTRGRDVIGMDRPAVWSLDPTWLGVHGAWR